MIEIRSWRGDGERAAAVVETLAPTIDGYALLAHEDGLEVLQWRDGARLLVEADALVHSEGRIFGDFTELRWRCDEGSWTVVLATEGDVVSVPEGCELLDQPAAAVVPAAYSLWPPGDARLPLDTGLAARTLHVRRYERADGLPIYERWVTIDHEEAD